MRAAAWELFTFSIKLLREPRLAVCGRVLLLQGQQADQPTLLRL
jgi:hypothetical protein